MGFEAKVLDTVAQVLGRDDDAEFTYGTLFVRCQPAEISALRTALNMVVTCGIEVSDNTIYAKPDSLREFAIDFTA